MNDDAETKKTGMVPQSTQHENRREREIPTEEFSGFDYDVDSPVMSPDEAAVAVADRRRGTIFIDMGFQADVREQEPEGNVGEARQQQRPTPPPSKYGRSYFQPE